MKKKSKKDSHMKNTNHKHSQTHKHIKDHSHKNHKEKDHAEKVSEEYGELRKLFVKVHAEAVKAKDHDSLRHLKELNNSIKHEVSKINNKPERVKELSQHLPSWFNKVRSVEKSIKTPKEKAHEETHKKHQENSHENKHEHHEGKHEHHQHDKSSHHVNHQAIQVKNQEDKNEKVIETYQIEVDGAKAQVKIVKQGLDTVYKINIPEIDVATSAFLTEIRNELTTATTVSMRELVDPKSFFVIKERFKQDASALIKKKLPHIDSETENLLVGRLLQEMLGLGRIEFLIKDPNLEEIVITSSKESIRVYFKKIGWLPTNINIEKEEDIINYSNIIARRVGKQITVLSPLLDAHLVTGDRINSVLYPINTKGNTITIRKFEQDPYTIIDLIKNNTCDIATASLLWLAIEYEMNVIISGGTASGKTVFLNACMPFVPPNHRIISIEDTRELMLPDFLYWTPLVTRTPNPEGKGGVSMLDLLINSLRMRPDRIILGEMRKHEEAMVLFEAMHTGHSVYATLHADSAPETVSRLINPPLNIPANLLRAVNLNVVMFRDRKRGIRRILQLAEIEAGGNEAKTNILYRWSPEKDQIIKHNESLIFFEELSRHTGMTDIQIKKDLEEKSNILNWMIKNEIRNLQDTGKIMNHYYKDKEDLLNKIKQNKKDFLAK